MELIEEKKQYYCNTCKLFKEGDEFTNNSKCKNKRDGKDYICRKCKKEIYKPNLKKIKCDLCKKEILESVYKTTHIKSIKHKLL